MNQATDQEVFWQGEFGNEYTSRNVGDQVRASNLTLFSKILSRTGRVSSVLELGSNIGLNLLALQSLLPTAELSAVEINEKAAAVLTQQLPSVQLHVESILNFQTSEQFDLVFTKGVLIHINPEKLPDVYELMFQCSQRYILVAEYYNPTPMQVSYRGHSERLFRRDFAGEIMDRFPSVRLVDYGFQYKRDPSFPMDDITWFLLEKS